jgi:hypothetical protein
MFITNPEVIIHKKGFSESIANYLENNGVPLLAIEENKYYFAETDLLLKALKESPWWVKLGIMLTP